MSSYTIHRHDVAEFGHSTSRRKSDERAGMAADNVRRVEIAIGVAERLLDFWRWWLRFGRLTGSDAAWREGDRAHYLERHSARRGCRHSRVLMVLLLDKHGDYRPCLSLLAVRETERLLRVTIAGFLLALPILLAVTKIDPAHRYRTGPGHGAHCYWPLEKWQVQCCDSNYRDGWGAVTRKAVILGTGAWDAVSSRRWCDHRNSDSIRWRSSRPTATVTEAVIYEASYQRKRQASVVPGPVTPKLLRRLGANVLILAAPEITPEESAAITSLAEAAGVTTYVIPEPTLEPGYVVEYVEVDGVLLAHKVTQRQLRLYETAKRALDVAASAFSLLLLAPALAAATVAVKVTSRGPVIFRQQRVGRAGVLFNMYKFRSMYSNSERYAYSPKSGRDPRITPVGRLLRHTCIDELPQLVNVLRGEMSLVGPRPEMPFIVEQYEEMHRRRLAVKPGITGLWQLSADRSSPIHQNISYDLYYVRNRSFMMDVAILLHTCVFAFRGV